MRTAVLIDTVVVSLTSEAYFPTGTDVMLLGQRWLNETEVGQWLQDREIKVEIRLKDSDDSAGSVSAMFVGRMTEHEHVEYLLRWGAAPVVRP